MQTAIVVYQGTSVVIQTNEVELEMCSMSNQTVVLPFGSHSYSLTPGIYKIVSSQAVSVTGETSAIETVSTDNKNGSPPLPDRATQSFPPLNTQTWNAFFATPDAKGNLIV